MAAWDCECYVQRVTTILSCYKNKCKAHIYKNLIQYFSLLFMLTLGFLLQFLPANVLNEEMLGSTTEM